MKQHFLKAAEIMATEPKVDGACDALNLAITDRDSIEKNRVWHTCRHVMRRVYNECPTNRRRGLLYWLAPCQTQAHATPEHRELRVYALLLAGEAWEDFAS